MAEQAQTKTQLIVLKAYKDRPEIWFQVPTDKALQMLQGFYCNPMEVLQSTIDQPGTVIKTSWAMFKVQVD